MLPTAKNDVFVGAITAIVTPIADFDSAHTLAIAALQLVLGAMVLAHVGTVRRFIAGVTAIVVTVAIKQLKSK